MGVQVFGGRQKTFGMKAGKTYDLAIIGGGIAGLTLANLMAGKGFSTIVFEKDKYPIHRVCGEYLSMEVWDFLIRLGLDLSQIKPPRIEKLKISSPSGKSFTHRMQPGGFGLSRQFLDKSLAVLAADKGATIMEATKVVGLDGSAGDFQIKTPSDQIVHARMVCGTHGKRDVLDKTMGRAFIRNRPKTNFVGVKYHVAANLPGDQIELHIFKGGYCGISQVEDGDFCLCYLVDARFLKEYKDIEKVERVVLMENPYLERYFRFPKTTGAVTLSQLAFGVKSVSEVGALFAGDSAGFIAPLTGNGMSMAMRSAFLLSTLLPVYFATGDKTSLINNYSNQWEKLFRQRIQRSIWLQKAMIDSPFVANHLVLALRNLPFLVSPLVRMTHGEPF
jgi:menaquinone-9 beta-reductase